MIIVWPLSTIVGCCDVCVFVVGVAAAPAAAATATTGTAGRKSSSTQASNRCKEWRGSNRGKILEVYIFCRKMEHHILDIIDTQDKSRRIL